VKIVAAAVYDPVALPEYIRRTQSDQPRVFSLMPPRERRTSSLDAAIAALPSQDRRWSSGEFKAIQDRTREFAALSRQPGTLRRRDGQ